MPTTCSGWSRPRATPASRQSAIGAFYTGAGRELFGGAWPLHVPATLSAAGMDPALAGAFTDAGWDRAIEASMVEAGDLCGSTAASPAIALESTPGQAFFGPALSRTPAGAEAVALWDAFVTMAGAGALYEIKRDRMGGLQLPA